MLADEAAGGEVAAGAGVAAGGAELVPELGTADVAGTVVGRLALRTG